MLKRALLLQYNRYRYVKDRTAFLRSLGVTIGANCRFLCDPSAFGSEPYLVSLGDHVTVTSGVQFITHDGGVWIFREQYPDIDVFGSISVGSNVFIGFGAIIMPGITIGDNCVIGAGSIVTKNIESGNVAAGVPARSIRSTEEYWDSVRLKALHCRSLPPERKKAMIISHLKELESDRSR